LLGKGARRAPMAPMIRIARRTSPDDRPTRSAATDNHTRSNSQPDLSPRWRSHHNFSFISSLCAATPRPEQGLSANPSYPAI